MSERIQVVSAVIVRAGRILLTQRDPLRSDYGWEWETPGGKVEPADVAEAERSVHAGALAHRGRCCALARELREELDVEALFDREPFGVVDFSPGDEGGRVAREVSVTFLRVVRMSGTPRLRQVLGLGWFTPEEAAGLQLIPATSRLFPQLAAAARGSAQ